MTITTALRHNYNSNNKVGGGGILESQAFIYQRTVFLSSPFAGEHAIGLLGWSDGEFQSCITHLIELAEEKTGCEALVIAVDKRGKEAVNIVLRALMYMGFALVHPSVYQQEPGFVLVGYEL
ncbi:hypothetical protein PHYBLDRAFT_157949 [Phycomyces blakesleeanus NRRL 1555(-)]|uniref:Uncharacterized protein n=2 Tax=Phycomyces blakesleeanus TaxID=4837 RepID=A0A167NTP5_PHYB8|nr:hypothetical protein PHYBLDRAFT_157949 [Phycomyces blakesleeanus NRRL 1555(-)]OAD76584.1 hypothetical protein PHYBLDRAFT_157949 [Phycomyces blakesleeanus NRRL 1555(-)]|eukprot:XP_018294624.1 hypothetical protein PHYBLDRAFT_157949 [Phycomyces blakesleeanus NRRL 1555(-)]